MKKHKRIGATVIKTICIIAGAALVIVCLMLLMLTVTEYRPQDEEPLPLTQRTGGTLSAGDSVTLLTWNAGFCSFYDGADFFMDGGKMVSPSDSAQVQANMEALCEVTDAQNPDIIFLQEVDRPSTRTHQIDQIAYFGAHYDRMEYAYATNFKAVYIPYPVPPIGQVDSGIMTLSRFAETRAVRIALPCPFSWPIRLGNLKRCLLVSRIPVQGTDKELVLINLHLEAYDDGSGKEAQTAQLRDLLAEEAGKGNYVIAGGDFNQSFFEETLVKYPAQPDRWAAGLIDTDAFPDTFSFYMDDTYPTCRSLDKPYTNADHETFQYYMLDGFIVSDGIEVNAVKTLNLDFRNSDHNPVILTFRIP